MRTLALGPTAQDLRHAIDSSVRPDYVYSYPPRQAYGPVEPDVLDEAVRRSLAQPEPLNLYFHFPFCRQICNFCNLFAVTGSADAARQYMDTVLTETRHYVPLVTHRSIDTIYLGGGTPSLLDAGLFGELFALLRSELGVDVHTVAEVALEVAPDTVDERRFAEYRRVGINRVNLGVQTWEDSGLLTIGRRHGTDIVQGALETVMGVGFDNVCVDLIYGLPGITDDTWSRSLDAVIEQRPETVCCYPLTVRSETGFGRSGVEPPSAAEQYCRYDTANGRLRDAGYAQQTQVRWAAGSRGGYRQKANHWAGQDILGIGAGARGYLRHVDYRNGYSARHRQAALRGYYQRVAEHGHGRQDGFVVDADERRRKLAVLGLGTEPCALPVQDWFPREVQAMVGAGAAVQDRDGRVALTDIGIRHRDVVVQLLFSDSVRHLASTHDYEGTL